MVWTTAHEGVLNSLTVQMEVERRLRVQEE
jgi:hypothetical protein